VPLAATALSTASQVFILVRSGIFWLRNVLAVDFTESWGKSWDMTESFKQRSVRRDGQQASFWSLSTEMLELCVEIVGVEGVAAQVTGS